MFMREPGRVEEEGCGIHVDEKIKEFFSLTDGIDDNMQFGGRAKRSKVDSSKFWQNLLLLLLGKNLNFAT
jgi:hypothetical protein